MSLLLKGSREKVSSVKISPENFLNCANKNKYMKISFNKISEFGYLGFSGFLGFVYEPLFSLFFLFFLFFLSFFGK